MSKLHRNSGSVVLIDIIAALLICMMMLPVTVQAVALLAHPLHFDETLQDQIAADQLRRIFLMAYDTEVSGSAVTFTYQNRECSLVQINDHVIMKPGTQIFFSDIESSSFYISEGVLMVEITRNGKSHVYSISPV